MGGGGREEGREEEREEGGRREEGREGEGCNELRSRALEVPTQ